MLIEKKRVWISEAITTMTKQLIAPIALMLTCIGEIAFAQSPAPLTVPNLGLYTNGTVHASVYQPDGGVVFGGNFTQVNGIERRYLARLTAAGDLDPEWNPGTAVERELLSDNSVYALATNAKGDIYVGLVGGAIFKISGAGNGAIDPTWGPVGTAPNLYSLVVDNAGDVYVNNAIVNYSSVSVGKFSGTDATLLATWTTIPSNGVRAIAVDGNQNLFIAGYFSQAGDQPRHGIAKLSAAKAGVVDAAWNPAPSAASGGISITALLPDNHGNVYVGGVFSSIGGQTRSNIAKLSSTGMGAADPTWNPQSNGEVDALAVDAKGALYVGGSFTSIGGLTRYNLAKLTTSDGGKVDATWDASTDNLSGNIVKTLTALPNGTVYAGGFFSTIAGVQRHSFAGIGQSGVPTAKSDTIHPYGVVNAIAAQSNGGLIVGGFFSGADDSVRSNVLRLQADGNVDPIWSASTDAPNGLGVEAVAVDSHNNVYLGGEFTQVGGQARTGIAKISADGAVDPAWGPGTSLGATATQWWYYGVEALGVAPNDDVYLGGDFSIVGGQQRLGLAKISAQGVLDPNWQPPTGSSLLSTGGGARSIAVDTDGSVFVGANYFLFKFSGDGSGAADPIWKGQGCGRVVKLDGHGSLFTGCAITDHRYSYKQLLMKLASTGVGEVDNNWQNSPVFAWLPPIYDADAGGIYALDIDSEGTLYVGGRFISANGETHTNLVKISSAGVITDIAWNPGANDLVNALALDGKGHIVVGGAFTQLGLAPRIGLAALPTVDDATPKAPGNLNQHGWTGAWYDPTASGQGLVIETFPDSTSTGHGTLFAGWFTYLNQQGTQPSEQQWYTLQGPVDITGNAAALGLFSTQGGYLDSTAAKPKAVQVGVALLTFTDCTDAVLAFHLWPTNSADYFGQDGTIALSRLDANVTCSVSGDKGDPTNYLLSGAWYTPATSGQGFMFDINPVQQNLFAAWYTFDADTTAPSAQHWYTLQAPFTPGVTSLSELPIYESSGGFFTRPLAASTVRVGTSKLTFTSCTAGSLDYVITDGVNKGKSGSIALTRTGPTPVGCTL